MGDSVKRTTGSRRAGLAQAELMSGVYDAAENWCHKVFDIVAIPDVNPLAWEMARRVLGIVRSHLGDPEVGVELCRESVAVATSAQARVFANLYLCVALLDAGRNHEAVNAALRPRERGQYADGTSATPRNTCSIPRPGPEGRSPLPERGTDAVFSEKPFRENSSRQRPRTEPRARSWRRRFWPATTILARR